MYLVMNKPAIIFQGGTSNHFDGKSTGSVSRAQGSLNTSSSVLLAKMKKRNTHELPGRSGSGIHQDTHGELLAEMRDFIATQCRVDGQATTDEILGRFSCRLPPSSTAVFRSLLHEICDFSRYHGDGMWTLKPEFRWFNGFSSTFLFLEQGVPISTNCFYMQYYTSVIIFWIKFFILSGDWSYNFNFNFWSCNVHVTMIMVTSKLIKPWLNKPNPLLVKWCIVQC